MKDHSYRAATWCEGHLIPCMSFLLQNGFIEKPLVIKYLQEMVSVRFPSVGFVLGLIIIEYQYQSMLTMLIYWCVFLKFQGMSSLHLVGKFIFQTFKFVYIDLIFIPLSLKSF